VYEQELLQVVPIVNKLVEVFIDVIEAIQTQTLAPPLPKVVAHVHCGKANTSPYFIIIETDALLHAVFAIHAEHNEVQGEEQPAHERATLANEPLPNKLGESPIGKRKQIQ